MGRRRKRLPWQYDEELQQFQTPSGVVTLKELAELRHGLLTAHVDLHGPWKGWRVQGSVITSRHGKLRVETAAQLIRWQEDAARQEMTAAGQTEQRRPGLRLVYSAANNRAERR